MPEPTAAEVRQAWGDALRLERYRRRLTQADVAAMAEVATPTITKAESGRGSLDCFLTIARVLDVELSTQEVAS
jgi:transcriptional regulator with XRE-family HTH domain